MRLEVTETFVEEAPTDYPAWLARYGGMATCGAHLGVFVGTDAAACPRGWIFLKLGEATAEQIADALAIAGRGRKEWR